jgi:hypothetical protein
VATCSQVSRPSRRRSSGRVGFEPLSGSTARCGDVQLWPTCRDRSCRGPDCRCTADPPRTMGLLVPSGLQTPGTRPSAGLVFGDLEVGVSRVAGHDDCLPTTGQVGALLWAQDTTGLPCSASSCPQHANDAWPFLTLCQFVLSISTELRGLPSSARHLDCFTDSLSLPNSRSGTTRSSHWQPLVEMGGLFAAEAVRLHASIV